MSDRFYLSEPISLGEVVLEGAEAHHLAHVRRYVAGDFVTLFNGDGREYRAEVIDAGKKRVHLHVQSVVETQKELSFRLHIGSALPKGDRGDFLIEKLTELGATDFTPLVTMRSVVVPKPGTVEKMQRAVIEASKQCGRNFLMKVHPALSIAEWRQSVDEYGRRWIAHPGGRLPSEVGGSTLATVVAIGPEGGFTDEEVMAAEGQGFERISLGPRILRVETAAIAIAALMGISGRN